MNEAVKRLRVKIYADGADLTATEKLADDPLIEGFTTNPTLMRQAGVDHYATFVKELTNQIATKPISFEVIADDFPTMERQAFALRDIAPNVYVKIPVTDTAGNSAADLMRRLAEGGVSVNATALMTLDQVKVTADALGAGPPAVISVFAGRIADAGIDPCPVMAEAKQIMATHPHLELLWASPREILNVVQADEVGCDIITLTPALLSKIQGLGRDLDSFSLATVKMFRDDAVAAGYEF